MTLWGLIILCNLCNKLENECEIGHHKEISTQHDIAYRIGGKRSQFIGSILFIMNIGIIASNSMSNLILIQSRWGDQWNCNEYIIKFLIAFLVIGLIILVVEPERFAVISVFQVPILFCTSKFFSSKTFLNTISVSIYGK